VKITSELLNDINEKPQDYTVVLEDWNEDKARYMKRLEDVFSDFVTDFIHLTARDYYIHPLSYEYLKYELNTSESFLEHIVEEYSDDYVFDDFVEALNKKTDTTGEIYFDLIEYELEQMDLDNLDDYEYDVGDEFVQTATFEVLDGKTPEEIPKEIMTDPVKLLKWIDEHSVEKIAETKPNSLIIDLINEANVDYIDHRSKGGRLWIFGGCELSDFVLKCEESGFSFHFKEGGAKATDGFDTWWCQ
jgi:hypothetical protein